MKPANSQTQIRWVVTASDLLLGDVIYLGAQDFWQRDLGGATPFSSPGAAGAALVRIASDQIIGAYVMEAAQGPDGALVPLDLRERFRSLGPSNRPLGKQATARHPIV